MPSDIELRNYFNFDESDLAANRAGRLSAKQNARLMEADEGSSKIFVWIGWGMLALGALITFILYKIAAANGFSLSGPSSDFGQLAALIVVWGILGPFSRFSFSMAKTQLDYSVQQVEGRIKFVRVEKQVSNISSTGPSHSTSKRYEMRVGGVVFQEVPSGVIDVIDENDTHIIYYTKSGKDVLSCEFVSSGK